MLTSWIWFILIGLAAGFLAGLFMKGRGFGLVINLVLGIVGGIVGGKIFDLLGIHTSSILGSLICAFIGAVVLLFVVSLFKKK